MSVRRRVRRGTATPKGLYAVLQGHDALHVARDGCRPMTRDRLRREQTAEDVAGVYRWWTGLVLLLVGLVALGGCGRSEGTDAGSVYEFRSSQHPEGTGKFYMGREIAQVIGHRGADWMERPSRETEELPTRVVEALELRPTNVVADIGAGTGYYTFRLSERVPRGRVFAVDIQPEMLDIIRQRIEEWDVTNVEPVLGTPTDPALPDQAVDVALMVDAYHEFSHPYEMMGHIVDALRPGGRVVLVEYRGEDSTIPVGELHRMTEEQAKKEMEAVGLEWRKTKDVLPQQHFMVFEKPLQ